MATKKEGELQAMSEPLNVAFVWHMHQPYYRSDRNAPFTMPWVRMHALKDYLDMLEILSDYPNIHQTFNLVPSLVEQLETYASGDFADIYWQHTMKPANDLTAHERAFIVERMCESPHHPRAYNYPRYLELAHKRESLAGDWPTKASTFTDDELRDLQIWFNLAWFGPKNLEKSPLCDLVSRDRNFTEQDKEVIAAAQQEILAAVLPAYTHAAARGQIEISTSPYFHPILPLLANTDSARVAAADTFLPRKRFAHPEDALEQLQLAIDKHEEAFGNKPQGVWCSEQAVGEDVLPLLLQTGFKWSISDETVLYRSLSGVSQIEEQVSTKNCSRNCRDNEPCDSTFDSINDITTDSTNDSIIPAHYMPYRLEREGKELSMVFRDHNLSDLIGFVYQSWDAKDAAADLIHRLHEIKETIDKSLNRATSSVNAKTHNKGISGSPQVDKPLVTIALDGENAWEYYYRDGNNFLCYLYEMLSTDPDLRCVTISEHLKEKPAKRSLDWLHTGSWIGGNLRTWIGDPAHSIAWELLHEARDTAAKADKEFLEKEHAETCELYGEAYKHRMEKYENGIETGLEISHTASDEHLVVHGAWLHILAAEGSDWFWWFGDHQHTELEAAWDLSFRLHLQEVYRLLGKNIPIRLLFPILNNGSSNNYPVSPRGPVYPDIDGIHGHNSKYSNDCEHDYSAEHHNHDKDSDSNDITNPADAESPRDEWSNAGRLSEAIASTMQRAENTAIREVLYGWNDANLCLLIAPESSQMLNGLEIQVEILGSQASYQLEENLLFPFTLEDNGVVSIEGSASPSSSQEEVAFTGAWQEVVEISLPLSCLTANSNMAMDTQDSLETQTNTSLYALIENLALTVRTGRNGIVEHVFYSAHP